MGINVKIWRSRHIIKCRGACNVYYALLSKCHIVRVVMLIYALSLCQGPLVPFDMV